jgi:eukaryotic-like serine/threonine-protein kinase
MADPNPATQSSTSPDLYAVANHNDAGSIEAGATGNVRPAKPAPQPPTVVGDGKTENAPESASRGHQTSGTDAETPSAIKPPCTFGDYDLLEEVGRGGMGVVYKARQRSLGRIVALKMVLESHRDSFNLQRRLDVEARAGAALDHPNIIPVYHSDQLGNCQYFTMAFVNGKTLQAIAKIRGLPVPDAVNIVRTVALAIEHMHKHGVIHRDLKPSNIMIDTEGRPRVSDFGLAKLASSDVGLTRKGQILGTLCYMAPEQARGTAKAVVGPAADIYALGGILYFTLTGKAPISGDSDADILLKVMQEPPPPLRQINPAIPAGLEAVCMKCLNKKPEERYASAGALAQALVAFAPSSVTPLEGTIPSDSPVSPPPTEPMTQTETGRPRRRFPVMLVGGIAAAVAVVGVGIYVIFNQREVPPSDPNKTGGKEGEVVKHQPEHQPLPPPWQKQQQSEFSVTLVPVGSFEGPAGELLIPKTSDGTVLKIEVERNCYVGVWTRDPDGKVVQLFPNDWEGDNLIRKGIPRLVPGNDNYRIRADVSEGMEQLCIVARSQKWDPIPSDKLGPFQLFKTGPDLNRLRVLTLEARDVMARLVYDFRVIDPNQQKDE